ncbi:hypothetical protein EAF00_008186 [Botryotinia globosa]|nr:hypothetical protein EAF00_008186 [Botryotinia globosa]
MPAKLWRQDPPILDGGIHPTTDCPDCEDLIAKLSKVLGEPLYRYSVSKSTGPKPYPYHCPLGICRHSYTGRAITWFDHGIVPAVGCDMAKVSTGYIAIFFSARAASPGRMEIATPTLRAGSLNENRHSAAEGRFKAKKLIACIF